MWYFKFRVVYWGECKRVATGVVAGENFVEVNKRLCDYYEDDSIEELSISTLDAQEVLESVNKEYKEEK